MSRLPPLPRRVKVVEVGPRDGLQNEAEPLSIATKVALIDQLSETGLQYIEAGSFVSPKWVPQMAGSGEVFAKIKRKPSIIYAGLTPNLRGFEDALTANVDEVALFASASESFSQKNINCSIEESLERFIPVMEAAKREKIPVRGYVSCVLGCPYEGEISPEEVERVADALIEMGCYEISLGDTIGVGTPLKTRTLFQTVSRSVDRDQLAGHFHNTYGQALANIYAALEEGIATFDSSISGLGGCPYAKGASGNVATEDLVYLLNGLNIESGIDLEKLVDVSAMITRHLGRKSNSNVANALLANRT